VAMDMLRGERRTQEGREELLEGQAKEDVAVTPLAIPMLAGPGAISTVIVLSGQAHGLLESGVVYGSIVLTGIVSFLALRVGEPLLGRLGKTGIRVVTRIMGLILAAVAAQFVLSGVKEAFGM
jgi:multiple antibiotic resistance protein